MPDPVPGVGEVRIALTASGINPGDIKKRQGAGSRMPYPRVIPRSDGAGIIDMVGPDVDGDRIGEAAWCYGAQSYRAFGTAADYVVVPQSLAVPLPSTIGRMSSQDLAEQASCLGIAGITGYRAVFADGPVTGLVVLVHGAVGGVGAIATQMAQRGGAKVVAVVRRREQLQHAIELGADHAYLTDEPELAEKIRLVAPAGVNRIAEVDLAAHIDLDAAVIAIGGTIASYFSSAERPAVPYWTLGFADATLRLLGSDDFTAAVKDDAAQALTAAVGEGNLRSNIAVRLPLEDIVRAHELVEEGSLGRIVLTLGPDT